MVRFTDYKIN